MRLIGTFVVLSLALGAQPTPAGFWTAWGSPPLSPGQIVAFAADGTTLASFSGVGAVAALAKHPSGVVFVVEGGQVRAYDGTGPTGLQFPPPAGGTVSDLAVAANGDLVLATGLLFGASILHRLTATGGLVGSWPLTGAFLLGLSADPFGGVWIVEQAPLGGSGFQVRHLDPSGVLGPIRPVPGAISATLVADPTGQAYVLSADGQLSRVDPAGTLQFTVTVPGALDLSLDPCGRPVVLAGSSLAALQVFDEQTGALVQTVPLNGASATYGILQLDALGRAWLVPSSGAAPALDVFDRHGDLLVAIPLPAPPLVTKGDATGRPLAQVTHPLADLDLDGFSNRHEALRGSDPLDATDIPATLVLSGGIPGLPLHLTGTFPADAGAVYAIGAAFS